MFQEGSPGVVLLHRAHSYKTQKSTLSLFKLTNTKIEERDLSSSIIPLAFEERLDFQTLKSTPCFAKGPFSVCKHFLTPNKSLSLSADFGHPQAILLAGLGCVCGIGECAVTQGFICK